MPYEGPKGPRKARVLADLFRGGSRD